MILPRFSEYSVSSSGSEDQYGDTEEPSSDEELFSVIAPYQYEPMAEDMPEDSNGSDEEVMKDSAERLASTDYW